MRSLFLLTFLAICGVCAADTTVVVQGLGSFPIKSGSANDVIITIINEAYGLQFRVQEYDHLTSELLVQFSVKMVGIVTYMDVDGVPGYNVTSDHTQWTWYFNSASLQWLSITDMPNVRNGTVHRIKATPYTNLQFMNFIGYIADIPYAFTETPDLFDGFPSTVVPPSSFKFDIDLYCDLACYHYTNTSRKAFLMEILSSPGSNVTFVNTPTANHSSVYVDGRGSFHWANKVLLRNSSTNETYVPVAVHALDLGNVVDNDADAAGQVARLISFAFDGIRPLSILWDPIVGVEPYSSRATSSSSTGTINNTGASSSSTGNRDGYPPYYFAGASIVTTNLQLLVLLAATVIAFI